MSAPPPPIEAAPPEVARGRSLRWWGFHAAALVAFGPLLVGGCLFAWKLGGYQAAEFVVFPVACFVVGMLLLPLHVIALRRCPAHVRPTSAAFALGLLPAIYTFLIWYACVRLRFL